MEKIRVLLVGSLVNYKAIIARKLALINLDAEFLEASNTAKAREIFEEYGPELTFTDGENQIAPEISFSLN